MKKSLIFLLVVLALVATACAGDSAAEGVASLEGSDPIDSAEVVDNTTDDQIDTEQAMLNLAQCIRDEGLDIDDPTVDADGNFSFRDLAASAEDVDLDELRSAFQACQTELEGVTLRSAGLDRTAIQDTLIDYAVCMRDNGYDMDDPDLTKFGPGTGGGEGVPGEGGGPFGTLDPDDPAFIAANEVCQEIFTSDLPRFLGGEGQGSGGEG